MSAVGGRALKRKGMSRRQKSGVDAGAFDGRCACVAQRTHATH
jgi:hypothetical protein